MPTRYFFGEAGGWGGAGWRGVVVVVLALVLVLDIAVVGDEEQKRENVDGNRDAGGRFDARATWGGTGKKVVGAIRL